MDSQELLVAIHEKVGGLSAKLDTYHEELTGVKGDVDKLKGQWARLMGMFAVLSFPFTALMAYLKGKWGGGNSHGA